MPEILVIRSVPSLLAPSRKGKDKNVSQIPSSVPRRDGQLPSERTDKQENRKGKNGVSHQ